MIQCKRRVVRLTNVFDERTRRYWVVRLNEGGHTVSVRLKGKQKWLTCTLKQIITMGAWNAAAHLKAERKRIREERRRQKGK